MSGACDIGIEVVFAEAERAIVVGYSLAAPASLADALRLAAADPRFADIDIAAMAVGVFGRVVDPAWLLEEGDRVELYRRLTEDPKSARRALVVLLAVVFVNIAGFGIVIPLLPFYGRAFHASAFEIALMFSAFSVGQLNA